MKKLLLSLGAIASVAAPVAAVVACGSTPAKGKEATTMAQLLADDKAAVDKMAKEISIEDGKAKAFEEEVAKNAKPAGADATARALRAQKDADIAIIKGGVDVNDDKASYTLQVEAATTLEKLKIIFDSLHVRLKDANSYENTHATAPKENTEQFAGKDITWEKTVDVTTLKVGEIIEIDDSGFKNLFEVVKGKWTAPTPESMKLDKTFDGITLITIDGGAHAQDDILVKSADSTHVYSTHTTMGPFAPMVENGRPLLVTRMGSVK